MLRATIETAPYQNLLPYEKLVYDLVMQNDAMNGPVIQKATELIGVSLLRTAAEV